MRKANTHFEQVPLAVVEKILEQQNPPTKRAGNRKRVAGKSRRTPGRPHPLVKNLEISTS
jgi:hypothetical protein